MTWAGFCVPYLVFRLCLLLFRFCIKLVDCRQTLPSASSSLEVLPSRLCMLSFTESGLSPTSQVGALWLSLIGVSILVLCWVLAVVFYVVCKLDVNIAPEQSLSQLPSVLRLSQSIYIIAVLSLYSRIHSTAQMFTKHPQEGRKRSLTATLSPPSAFLPPQPLLPPQGPLQAPATLLNPSAKCRSTIQSCH
jgi:hypothetical protein